MSNKVLIYLNDIKNAIISIENFIDKMNFDQFKNDNIT